MTLFGSAFCPAAFRSRKPSRLSRPPSAFFAALLSRNPSTLSVPLLKLRESSTFACCAPMPRNIADPLVLPLAEPLSEPPLPRPPPRPLPTSRRPLPDFTVAPASITRSPSLSVLVGGPEGRFRIPPRLAPPTRVLGEPFRGPRGVEDIRFSSMLRERALILFGAEGGERKRGERGTICKKNQRAGR